MNSYIKVENIYKTESWLFLVRGFYNTVPNEDVINVCYKNLNINLLYCKANVSNP